jgi:uncharacterized protein YjbI with pentapeptide repeats
VTTYGRTREDVVRWPDDPAARQALEAYLGSLLPDSQDVLSMLDAEGRDFTGANLSGLELLGAIPSEATLTAASALQARTSRA